MANDILTTSSINSLITSYIANENEKLITPITKRVSKYQSLSSVYSILSSKLDKFKSLLTNLRSTESSSLFNAKSAASSNTSFITASAGNSASVGAYGIRVNQLAKNDLLVSQELSSTLANAVTGTQYFTVKTGDGSGGEYISNIEVALTGTETNQTVMEKIRDAINADKAVVSSSSMSTSSSYSGGTSTFKINLNGTEKSITVNGGGTYEELIDELVSKINTDISGVTAEKVVDSPNPGDVKLKLTVGDASKYISITHESGFDLVSDLNIGVTKEKGASGIVTASVLSPVSGFSQFTLTTKETGVDFRIKELSDNSTYSALSSIGLNLGSDRPTFNQSTDPDTTGYVYSDITVNSQLNAIIEFNGLNIQRNSNVVSDLVSGVTFSLKSLMEPTDPNVNVTVTADTSSIKTKIEDFITQFNDIYTYIKAQQESSNTTGRGVLSSDGNASTLLSTLSELVYSKVPGISDQNINTLYQIGLTFNSNTGLSISDSSKLEQKIRDNGDEIAALFNSTDGISNALYNKINPYLGIEGYLSKSKSNFESNIKALNDRKIAGEKRINKSSIILRQRYEQLQAQLASILTIQNFFSYTTS